MEESLERMVRATNSGFAGGKVTRHALLSWIVTQFEKRNFQECLQEIRQEHFDQLAYLEAVLKEAKKARKAGAAPDEIAALLAPVAAAPTKTTAVRKGRRPEQSDLPMG